MELVINVLEQYNTLIIIGLGVCSLILMLLVILCLRKLNKIQRRYERFMQKEEVNLEELLVTYADKVVGIHNNQESILASIKHLEEEMACCVQKVGIVRYKAMDNVGADLSFAIALLDASENGVVLNGIYSREGSYTYAKPIQQGKSTYRLSEEEEEAINKARVSKSN